MGTSFVKPQDTKKTYEDLNRLLKSRKVEHVISEIGTDSSFIVRLKKVDVFIRLKENMSDVYFRKIDQTTTMIGKPDYEISHKSSEQTADELCTLIEIRGRTAETNSANDNRLYSSSPAIVRVVSTESIGSKASMSSYGVGPSGSSKGGYGSTDPEAE